ncbi:MULTISPECIES: hypothetical protein [unclassified Bradyrhizobium]|uniref:hypothetical protein n=1 Tax=unclassified Bradyrhizobium TaxID=2631580 RepID=UPI002916B984|nr:MULTISPECIES: hypothetical protein [unclassified Bradyrhizobium]
MSQQQQPDYHEGFFDSLDGEPLFENECSADYLAGWLAAHECRTFLDRAWSDVPAELQARFPAHYARL